VAVMVGFELLGHGRTRSSQAQAAAEPVQHAGKPAPVAGTGVGSPAAVALPAPRRPRARGPAAAGQAGSVKGFFKDYIFPAEEGGACGPQDHGGYLPGLVRGEGTHPGPPRYLPR
jgi:hypothetical protein